MRDRDAAGAPRGRGARLHGRDQDFQDPYTLDVSKLRKCCVSEIVPDGRLIPFCAYNSVGYREQVRLETAGNGNGARSRR